MNKIPANKAEDPKLQAGTQAPIAPEKPVESDKPAEAEALVHDKVAATLGDVELDRPGSKEPKLQTRELQVRLGRDNLVSEALTSKMRDNVRVLATSILKGTATAYKLPTIEAIDSDKGLNRSIAVSVGQKIIVNLSNSKEHKALARKIKKAKKASDILMAVEGYSGADKIDIDNLFAESVLAMYGLVNPDNISSLLSTTKVAIDSKEVSLADSVAGLLGSAPSENSMAGQVVRKLLADHALSAGTNSAAATQLAKILKACAAARVSNASSEDQVLKDTLASIASFDKDLTAAKSVLGNAAIVREVEESDEKDTASKRATLEARLSTIKNENSATIGQIDAESAWVTANPITARSTDAEKALFQQRSANLTRLKRNEAAQNDQIKEIQAALSKIDAAVSTGNAQQQKVELAKAKADFASKVALFAANIQRRVEQLAANGVTVDLSKFKALNAFLEAIKAIPSAATTNEKVVLLEAALGNELNLLNIKKELAEFSGVIGDKRPFTEEEFAVTFLKSYYTELGYSEQQSEMAAIIEYTRRERESKLAQFWVKANEAKQKMMDGTMARFWKEKVKGEVEYVTGDRAIVVCARNPKAGSESQESSILEGLTSSRDYASVRRTLIEGGVSRNTLTTFMYELMSLVGGRKIDDGTFMTLKSPEDVAIVENMVLNISKFLSEDSALEVISRTEELAKTPEGKKQARVELVANSLKAFNDELSNTEVLLATAAFTGDSAILTKGKIKRGIKSILEQLESSGMSKDQFLAALQEQGINGLENGFAIRKLRVKQIGEFLANAKNASVSGARKFGAGIKNKTVAAYKNRGKIARNIWNGLTLPVRLPVRALKWGANKTLDLVSTTAKNVAGVVTYSSMAAGHAATTLATAPIGIAKATFDGAQIAVASQRNLYEQRKGRVMEFVKRGDDRHMAPRPSDSNASNVAEEEDDGDNIRKAA